ncbi:MAG: monovalent cation/H+ antiporter subunit D family protein [Arenicellales bacterium]|nr:monovalent cation/H+ antiporter subunit D family protein [Arenicellales bacterium]
MISAHLPALQVVIPLLAAPACVVVRQSTLTWLLALLVSWISFAIALTLLVQTFFNGPMSYELGGWAAPLGIEYAVDVVNAFVLVIVSGVSSVVLISAKESIERETHIKRTHLVYTGWLLCLTGLLGITITGDVFNVFVFLEIASLSSYLLVSLGPDRRALTAAFQYLVMGTIGATFILIGVGLLYMMTGTLNMADLAQRIPGVAQTTTVRAGFAFLVLGISLKAAVFPLHYWLPNAYTFAPSAVTAFMAGSATKVSIYLLLRFFFDIFSETFSLRTMRLDLILLILGVIAIFSMSLVAIYQSNVKRMLAYSSVAQVGYMVIGISLATTTGLTAGIVHLFNHALMKCALFLALGCIVFRLNSVDLKDLAGVGRRMPWTMAAFVIGGLSLIGVPATVGFISKWYLVLAALERDWWWLAFMVVASSLLAVIYIWRVVETAYFKTGPVANTEEAPLILLVPTWVLIVANIYFGVSAVDTISFATRAADQLLSTF